MGIFDRIITKKHVNVALTELGKHKAEQAVGQGPKLTILSDLAENGASTVPAISSRTGLNEQRVKEIVNSMRSEGWLRVVNTE